MYGAIGITGGSIVDNDNKRKSEWRSTGMEYRSREFDNGVSMGTNVRVGKIMPMDVWSDGGMSE